MRFGNFTVYAERLLELGVKGFILTGGGEPTINPDFDKIAGWLSEKGIHWGINTNFNVLKLIRPNYLKVSLDGWDEKSYEAARGVKAYSRTVKNIADFCEWKKNCGVKTNVGIQMVVGNPDNILRFYETNKGLPVDYIVFRPMESTRASAYNSDEAKANAARAVGILEELKKEDERVKINFKWFELGTCFDSCLANWSQIAINTSGDVMYCCHKPYEIVCHLMDEDVMEKKSAFSTNIAMCDVPCRLTGANKCLLEIDGISEPEFI